MSDRRTLLALLIIGLILLLTPYYMELMGAGSRPGPAPAADSTRMAAVPPPEPVAPLPAPPREAVPVLPVEPGGPGRVIVVETPRYIATVSRQGALLTGWELKEYRDLSGNPVRLIPEGAFALALDLPDGDARLELTERMFQTTAPDTVRLAAGETRTLVLSLELEDGRRVTRGLSFSADTWDVDVSDRLEGFEVSALNDAYRLWWIGGLNLTETKRREELQYTGFYALQGGEVQKTRLKATPQETVLSGSIAWAALRTKYFTGILIPRPEAFRAARMNGAAGDLGPALMNVQLEHRMPTAGEEVETLLYLGPIDYHGLLAYQVDLQKMMDFGWGFIRPISKLILNLFTWLHRIIPNYGLVIIIFSVLVKIVVYPLTRKSYESMHAMQEISPKLQEIREKYKDDSEKMNRKMMNLYKEHGVNPLGGCFPLLLQMPVFFALYAVFRSTIELRGAPFVFWITDLSVRDPYMVIPGLMALTMFIQQRAQLKNPQQRALTIMMPVMMFFLFRGLSAGLVLYWTMFNVLSIIQTEIVHPRKPVTTS
jgi:YidC/Oxa1 family membrane protein insertase